MDLKMTGSPGPRYNFSSRPPMVSYKAPVDSVHIGSESGPQSNPLAELNTTTSPANCSNNYCYSDKDYMDMILDYIAPDSFEWVLIVFYGYVFIIGLVGNALVCFAVCKNQHMRTFTNLFIVNLAVADILVILICLPPTVLEDVTETWYMGSLLCKIVKYVQSVSVSVSVLTLTAISIERYFAICDPMTFKGTTRRARIIISVIWVVSLFVILPETVPMSTQATIPGFTVLLTTCAPRWSHRSQVIYQVFQLIVLYVLPLGLMAVAYAQIAIVLWSNSIPTESSASCGKRVSGANGTSRVVRSPAETQLHARRKVAKMLIAVVVLFGLCYLPVHLLNILRYSGVTLHTRFALVAHWLCYFNSAINPIVYNFMSETFRKAFHQALICGPRRANTPTQWLSSKPTRVGGNATTPTIV